MDQSEIDKSAVVPCTHTKLGGIGRNSKERCNLEDCSPKVVADSRDRNIAAVVKGMAAMLVEECIVMAAAVCIGPQVVDELAEMTGSSLTSPIATCRHAYAYCSHLRPSADPPSSS